MAGAGAGGPMATSGLEYVTRASRRTVPIVLF